MKLPIQCPRCLDEKIKNSTVLGTVEFRDDGRYEFRCQKGHKSLTILQQQKFEILFDIGAYAINDGYYREAVVSFRSSLERFYEFVIKVILLGSELDNKTIEETYNHLSKKAERELGAFISLYLREFKKTPKLFSNKEDKFRNEVVHEGKIPTRQEAIKYGQAILDIIRPIIKDLKDKFSEGIKNSSIHYLINRLKIGDGKLQVSTLYISTIIGLYIDNSNHQKRSLEEALSKLIKW